MTRSACVTGILLLALATARADPAPTYAQAMAEGARKLAARDARGAAASFRAALAARRDDPRALTELSWASLLAGDAAAAVQPAAYATYYARDTRMRAAAYYNLGRAHEALGHAVDAQAAYMASLTLRDLPEI